MKGVSVRRGSTVNDTDISRKVVWKSARDNPERYCSWFWGSLFFKQIWKNDTTAHGGMFASAEGKQQK